AISRRAETNKVLGPVELASTLADPEQGPAVRDSFISGIKKSPEPEKSRESLVSMLEQALAQAPESQRAAVQGAIDAVRQLDTSIKAEETERRPVAMMSLALDARVMLVDSDNPNRDKLESIVNEFQIQYLQKPGDANVTPERYRVFSEAIRGIDPEFQKAWRKQVLLNYPELDRILPHEGQ